MEAEQLITRFYTAFANGDAAEMRACYHPEVVFRDPIFGELRGEDAGDMWAMLLSRGASELNVDFRNVRAAGDTGSADWTARYRFGPKRRPVTNQVHATFHFRDGLIAEHTDTFDRWRWARQALGPAGWLLGWAPFLHAKVRAGARGQLAAWQAKR